MVDENSTKPRMLEYGQKPGFYWLSVDYRVSLYFALLVLVGFIPQMFRIPVWIQNIGLGLIAIGVVGALIAGFFERRDPRFVLRRRKRH